MFDNEIPSSVDEIVSKEIIYYHPGIEDETYSKHITIKKFTIEEVETNVGMFNEKSKKFELEDINDNIKIEIYII